MGLQAWLTDRRAPILQRWHRHLLESYPPDFVRFLDQEKDQFRNPVGHVLGRAIEALWDGLLGGARAQDLRTAVDGLVRVRAVQDFSASEAVGFIFGLKQIIRSEPDLQLQDAGFVHELFEFESRIDEIGFLAFDIYMECREKTYAIKADEMKRRTYKLLERMNRIYPDLDKDLSPPSDSST